MSDDQQQGATDDAAAEIAALRAELDRLRLLVGPSEKSYELLQLDVLAARDAAIGAEFELGVVRASNQELESEVVRLRRDFDWFRTRMVARLRRARSLGARATRVVTQRQP